MTNGWKRDAMNIILGAVLGGALSGAGSMLLVGRKLDVLTTQLEERKIAQDATDREQDRRINDIDARVYILQGRDK